MQAETLRSEMLLQNRTALSQEAARPLMLELIGWRRDPVLARRWAVLQEILRLRGHVQPWQETAPLDVACASWHYVLPCAQQILQELGWWATGQGAAVCRRDAFGRVRTFRLGVDGDDVLLSWLVEWHRRRALRSCGRIYRDFHREDDAVARGPALGVPRDPLCL